MTIVGKAQQCECSMMMAYDVTLRLAYSKSSSLLSMPSTSSSDTPPVVYSVVVVSVTVLRERIIRFTFFEGGSAADFATLVLGYKINLSYHRTLRRRQVDDCVPGSLRRRPDRWPCVCARSEVQNVSSRGNLEKTDGGNQRTRISGLGIWEGSGVSSGMNLLRFGAYVIGFDGAEEGGRSRSLPLFFFASART